MEEKERSIIKNLKKSGKKLSNEAKDRSIGYIEAGLGLVAGLAWNEAIKTTIETLFPVSKSTVIAKFIYALIITVIIVAISVNLRKISGLKDENSN